MTATVTVAVVLGLLVAPSVGSASPGAGPVDNIAAPVAADLAGPNALRALQLRFAATSGTPASRVATGAAQRAVDEGGDVRATAAQGSQQVATSGNLTPRYVDFTQVASTPLDASVWRVIYGLQFTGGLVGQTDDIEFQILDASGAGSINSSGVFAGALDGRQGGFIFEAEGTQNSDGTFAMDFTIVPGTGHGQLSGVTGKYEVIASRGHCAPTDTPETCETLVSYTMNYRLPAA